MEKGQCAPTFYASNNSISRSTKDEDFDFALGELIDICLILSFFTGACVTPRGTTGQSEVQFLQLGDSFLPPRAIRGFDALKIGQSFQDFFSRGLVSITSDFSTRRARLFLAHWISGLTCFTLEDLFLSIGVQMDIVKQCEIQATGASKTYFEGMRSASARYQISEISGDYKNMRNDIVHEGKLSGTNFSNKSKSDCAQVTADSLNWVDKYILSVLSIDSSQIAERWKAGMVESGLPALSFHV
ncbi:hypothetical protein KW410_12055 [Vibrio fluvialis]|nr:hypothetical protein [Vibrio fluvialis]